MKKNRLLRRTMAVLTVFMLLAGLTPDSVYATSGVVDGNEEEIEEISEETVVASEKVISSDSEIEKKTASKKTNVAENGANNPEVTVPAEDISTDGNEETTELVDEVTEEEIVVEESNIMSAGNDEEEIPTDNSHYNVQCKKVYAEYLENGGTVENCVTVEYTGSHDYSIKYSYFHDDEEKDNCPVVDIEHTQITVKFYNGDDVKYQTTYQLLVDDLNISMPQTTYDEDEQEVIANVKDCDDECECSFSLASDAEVEADTSLTLSALKSKEFKSEIKVTDAKDYYYYVKVVRDGYVDFYTTKPICFTVNKAAQSEIELDENLFTVSIPSAETCNFGSIITNKEDLFGEPEFSVSDSFGIAKLVYEGDAAEEEIPAEYTNSSGMVDLSGTGYFTLNIKMSGDDNHLPVYKSCDINVEMAGDPIICFKEPVVAVGLSDDQYDNDLKNSSQAVTIKSKRIEKNKINYSISKNVTGNKLEWHGFIPHAVSCDIFSLDGNRVKIAESDLLSEAFQNNVTVSITIKASYPDLNLETSYIMNISKTENAEPIERAWLKDDLPLPDPATGWYNLSSLKGQQPYNEKTSLNIPLKSTYSGKYIYSAEDGKENASNVAHFTNNGIYNFTVYCTNLSSMNLNVYEEGDERAGMLYLDTERPEINSVVYSAPSDDRGDIYYYGPNDSEHDEIKITVTASDVTSGLKDIKWEITSLEVSGGTVVETGEVLGGDCAGTKSFSDDGSVSFNLPISDIEYFGRLVITVTDNAGNEKKLEGKIIEVGKDAVDKNIIVDSTAPNVYLYYSPAASSTDVPADYKCTTYDGTDYYRTDVDVTVEVYEDNFDLQNSKDFFEISAKREGKDIKDYISSNLSFKTIDEADYQEGETAQGYKATFTLHSEALYEFEIKAHDYSKNEGESVVPNKLIIDKTAPEIEANYSNPIFDAYCDETVGYYGIDSSSNCAEAVTNITIFEKNFEGEQVKVYIEKDGNLVDSDLYSFVWDANSSDDDDDDGEDGKSDAGNGDAGNGDGNNGTSSFRPLQLIRNYIFGLEEPGGEEPGGEEPGGEEPGGEEPGGEEPGGEEPGGNNKDDIKHETDIKLIAPAKDPSEANYLGDGSYYIVIMYTDRAGNVMKYKLSDGEDCKYSLPEAGVTEPVEHDCFLSKKLVLDSKPPVVSVTYSNSAPKNTLKSFFDDATYKYYNQKSLNSVINVKEVNFIADEFVPTVTAKDVNNGEITYGNIIPKEKDWVAKENGVYEANINYSTQANYSFSCACKDLAGNKASDYKADYFTLDSTNPTITGITYSTPILDTVLNGITFGFYNNKINVTVNAEDCVAGVHEFNYSYIKATGVSGINAELRDQVISEEHIKYSDGHKKASITFSIPKDALDANHQFNGTVKASVSDRSDNSSSKEDNKRLVADNIAPNATVTYNAPVAENNGKVYYASDINGTITINEANFYASDVQILVAKNGVENTLSTSWTDDNTDVHVGRFTLVEEGEYIVKINYKDKSTNAMNEYVSELMVIDKTIEAPVFKINGVNKDGDNGGAYKENLNVAYEFSDQNFKSATTKLTKTRFDEKNDITEQYIKTTTTANGGNGTFDIAKDVDSDGIYLLEVSMSDYAGHTIDSFVKFTANRYGSVYEYSDYLAWIISDGGQFIKLTGDETVTEDLVITEYNPDMVENGSLNISATRDGEAFDVFFTTTPSDLSRSAEPSPNGWYKYVYTISKQNFKEDGTYKLSISSSDETGNTSISVPENSIDSNGNKILDVMGFTVDTTCPELKNIINLEDSVIRSSNLEVKYSIVDLGGIKSIEAYVDGQPVATAADLTVGLNNYNGSFFVGESDAAQEVRLVIEDIAGNVTDTDDAQWKQEQERAGSYVFRNPVTVSTNFMVLWLANKFVFFGSIGAASVLVIGGAVFIIARRKRF